MKAQYLAFLSIVTISTTSICADRPTIHSLIKASDHELRSLSQTAFDARKQRLEAYIKETERDFNNESVFFGLSRATVCNTLATLGSLSFVGGCVHSGLDHMTTSHATLQQVCSITREKASCYLIKQHDYLELAGIGIGTAFSIILFGTAECIGKHPAQSQLERIAAIERQRIKAAIHAVMSKRS